MEKNELNYRLETETAKKRRLENQLVELAAKNNELDS